MTAQDFHALHHGPPLLVLANAWDAGSARLIASLGARAIATSSAALAWAHGHPDGDALPVELLLGSVTAMARAIAVPLSVDIEGGYSDAPDSVAWLAAALIDAGAVGINIEDGSAAPALLEAKIAAIRAAADAAGVPLFINARCDVFLRQLQPPPAAVAEALRRAAGYRAAGADGFFVPGVPAADIAAIVAGCALPVNIMARPDIPDAAALQALGVRRLSAGSGIAQAMWATVETLATDFLATGDCGPVSAAGALYPRLNAVMRGSG